MLRLMSFLWSGCWHTWEIHSTTHVYDTAASKMPSAIQYHLRCSKCGDMKAKRMAA